MKLEPTTRIPLKLQTSSYVFVNDYLGAPKVKCFVIDKRRRFEGEASPKLAMKDRMVEEREK